MQGASRRLLRGMRPRRPQAKLRVRLGARKSSSACCRLPSARAPPPPPPLLLPLLRLLLPPPPPPWLPRWAEWILLSRVLVCARGHWVGWARRLVDHGLNAAPPAADACEGHMQRILVGTAKDRRVWLAFSQCKHAMARGHMAEPLCLYFMGSWLGQSATNTSSQSCLGFSVAASWRWPDVERHGADQG